MCLNKTFVSVLVHFLLLTRRAFAEVQMMEWIIMVTMQASHWSVPSM